MLACYFYRHPRHKSGLQSYCITCNKIRMQSKNLTPGQKAYRKQYTREYKAAQRREQGVPVRVVKEGGGDYGETRTTGVIEYIPAAPLREGVDSRDYEGLAAQTGLELDAVYDAFRENRVTVSMDVADRIIMAVGKTMRQVYGARIEVTVKKSA